uniref:ANK_REP_REGION domain-containing protein n=1 Tax=Panagrolaimus sp. ES5 TaxID=591445 RepID=A0AC34FSM0_9BILA
MKYNPDVNAKDSELWTPLHAAAFCGNNEIVKLLIENGADLLAVNSERNMAFELCSAVDTLNIIEAEMAKRNITEEKIKEKRDERPKQMLEDMKLLQQKGEALDIRQYDGSTFLHAAAANGYSEVVAFLLSSGVEPNLKDIDGWTSLHAAAFWNQISIINLLCENGANVEDKTFAGETAYDLAQDDATRAAIKTIQKQNCSGMKMIESK